MAYYAQLCLTLCDPMEWFAIPFSRGSSQPRDQTYISCTSRRVLHRLSDWTSWTELSHQGTPLVQSSSITQSCPTFCDPMDCSTPGLPVHHQLPEFTQTHVHWVGDAIQPSHPLWSLLLPPSIFPSIRVFSNESVLCIRWSKYWSFSFSISPSNEYLGLISFRIDWFDLLAVQGAPQESSPTPQFKSINSSVLSFLHSPTLTSIHDHWKNHSLD